MRISVIIPTLNEEKRIEHLISFLRDDASKDLIEEIIVVDGNSSDRTVAQAQLLGATVIECDQPSRAVQMNIAADHAAGDILYFLHADTLPPALFARSIYEAVNGGYMAGCFRLKFDWNHWLLNMSGWFTRFSSPYLRFGDQSLFITREVFNRLRGFAEDLRLFEDQDLVKRIVKQGPFKVLPEFVVTSSRKYQKNGVYRLQLVYFWIFLMYTLGFSQKSLVQVYRNMISDPMI